SAVIARALRLDDAVRTADLGGSVRSGLAAAIQAAPRAAAAEFLLLAADRRDVEPGGDLETALGDAGAAARIGPGGDGDLAALMGTGSVAGRAPGALRVAG